MKKFRILLSSILMIALCISLVASGTFALFSNEGKTNIAVTSGQVDIVATADIVKAWSTDWDKNTNGYIKNEGIDTIPNGYQFTNQGTAVFTGNTLTINNITPGDGLQLDISILNKSTVKTKYRIEVEETVPDSGLLYGLDVSYLMGEENVPFNGHNPQYTDWMSLSESKDVKDGELVDTLHLVIELPHSAGNDYQDMVSHLAISVFAVQANGAVDNPEQIPEPEIVSTKVSDYAKKNWNVDDATERHDTIELDDFVTLTTNVTDSGENGTYDKDTLSWNLHGDEDAILKISVPDGRKLISFAISYVENGGSLYADSLVQPMMRANFSGVLLSGATYAVDDDVNEVTLTVNGVVQITDVKVVYSEVVDKTNCDHVWKEENITWNWAVDYSSATATIKCDKDETHTHTAKATVAHTEDTATCEDGGVIVHTATVTFTDIGTYTKVEEQSTEALGHDYQGDWHDNGDGTHYQECANDASHHGNYTAHNWDNGQVTTPATCEGKGVKTYTCDDCKATKTEDVDELGHKYTGEWINGGADGHYQVCENNNAHHNIVAHSYDEKNRHYISDESHANMCDYCDYVDVATTAPHSTDDWTNSGDKHTGNCDVCDTAMSANHNWVKGDVVIDPTCEEMGTTAYTCSDCDAYKTEQDVPALNHNYTGEWINGGADGHYQVCENNNAHHNLVAHSYDDNKLGHNSDGHWFICDECDYEDETQDHYWMWTVKTAPTCTTKGEDLGTCECGETTTRVVGELDHDLDDVAEKPATCDEDGYTAHKACKDCDYTTDYTVLDKTGHKYEFTKFNWADDYSSAEALLTCANDPEHTTSEKATVEKIYTAPTCEEDGYYTHTASITLNDQTYSESKTSAGESKTGHKLGEWQVVGDKHVKSCSNSDCDYKLTHKAEMTDWAPVEGKHETHCQVEDCTVNDSHEEKLEWKSADGKHWQACADCDYATVKADHEYKDWTHTENHNHVGTCECDDKYTEACTPANGYISDKDAGHHQNCAKCGEALATVAHNYENGVCKDCEHAHEGHEYGVWKSDNDSAHSKTCDICGDVQTANHSELKWSTEHYQYCEDCDYKTEPADHKYTWKAQDGNHVGTCVCGATDSHVAEESWGKWSNHRRECDNCDMVEDHSQNVQWTAWTDNKEEGNHIHSCTQCGATETAEHSYTWNQTSDPSCTAEGEKLGTCVCGATTTEKVDKLEHSYGAWIDATVGKDCLTAGTVGHYECSECHNWFDIDRKEISEDDRAGAYGAHNYEGEWINGGADGHYQECANDESHHSASVSHGELVWAHNSDKHWKKCADCDYETEEATHNMSGWDVSGETHINTCTDNCGYSSQHTEAWQQTAHQDATCTADGYTTYKCSGCNEEKTDTHNKIAHDYTNVTPAWSWTNDYTSATATFKCNNCNHTEDVVATSITTETTADADCKNDRKYHYVATVSFNNNTYTGNSVELTDTDTATGHAWTAKWNWTYDGDNTTATVTFTCGNNATHTETESAEVVTSYSIPTCEADGLYTHNGSITFDGQTYSESKTSAGEGKLQHVYTIYVGLTDDDSKHILQCELCNNATDEFEHTYEGVTPVNHDDYNHKYICSVQDCEGYKLEAHDFGTDGNRHDCACGEKWCGEEITISITPNNIATSNSYPDGDQSMLNSDILSTYGFMYKGMMTNGGKIQGNSSKNSTIWNTEALPVISGVTITWNTTTTAGKKLDISFSIDGKTFDAPITVSYDDRDAEQKSYATATEGKGYKYIKITTNGSGAFYLDAIEICNAAEHAWQETGETQPANCQHGMLTEMECIRCGATKMEDDGVTNDNHSFTDKYGYDNDNHWLVCDNCDAIKEDSRVAHDNLSNFSSKNDDTHTAHCLTCGNTNVEQAHSYEDGVCTVEGCEHEHENHDFGDDGDECIICGAEKPEEQPGPGEDDEPAVPHYKKVTSTDDLVDGQYLIVYENGNVAFDGSRSNLDAANNTITITINDDGTIAHNETTVAAEFEISTIDGGYSIKSASGYYIGQTSNANGLASNKTTVYTNTISFADSDANIISGGAYLRYNATSNNNRFRYYQSSTYASQQAIQLYIFVEPDCEHDGTIEHVDEQPATCEAAGLEAHYKCTNCGKTFSDEGQTEYTPEVLDKLAHSYGGAKGGQAATCTADGWNDYYECATCHKYFSNTSDDSLIGGADALEAWKLDSGKLNKLPHSFTAESDVEELDNNKHKIQCKDCEEYYEHETHYENNGEDGHSMTCADELCSWIGLGDHDDHNDGACSKCGYNPNGGETEKTETLIKTLTFGSGKNSKSVSSYENEWSVDTDDFTWNVTNFNNNNNGWTYVRAGSKNAASVATITTGAAIPQEITKIILTIDSVTAANINSIKLEVSESTNFANAKSYSFTVAQGSQEVIISTPAKNLYYKISIDCKQSSNGIIQISKVEYYGYDLTGGGTTDPTPDQHKCEDVCLECGGCLTDCADPVCATKCDCEQTGGETTPVSGTLSFADKAQRTTYTTTQQIWEQNGIKLTNDKDKSTTNVGDYANPVRLYASSKVLIEAKGILKIVFKTNSTTYASDLKTSLDNAKLSGATVSVSGSDVTVTFASAVDSIEFTCAKQIQLKSIDVNL